MKRMPPNQQDCSKRVVQDDERGFTLLTWHPQWGGYSSVCEVRFDRVSGDAGEKEIGCFDVTNWHDGEFPTEDPNEATTYHYCSAEQIVSFGLDVIEAQVSRQRSLSDKPVSIDPAWLEETIARLKKLRPEAPQADQHDSREK
jgi:hypothetical protein